MNKRGAVAVAGLLGTLASAAGAQEAALVVRAGRAADETGASRTGLSISPSFRWEEEGVGASIAAQGIAFREGGALASGAIEVRSVAATLGPVSLVLGAGGAAAGSDAGYAAVSGALTPELRLSGAGMGVAAGAYIGSAAERVGGRGPASTPILPLHRAAEPDRLHWRGVSGARAAGWATHGAAAGQVGWSELVSEGVRWSDWTAGASLELGPAAVGGEIGRRSGAVDEEWASASAALRISGVVTVVGGAGRFPSDPITGRAGGHFASAGLALRTSGGARR